MGIIKWNDAEGGGAHLTDVTAANSGGRSGDAFNTVATDALFEYRTSTWVAPFTGRFAYFANPASAACYGEWSMTALEFWGSGYWQFYPSSNLDPGAGTTVFVQALGAADAAVASLEYDTLTGKVAVLGVNSTGKATSTGAHLHLVWMRIDWHFKSHASAGVAEARVYFDAVGAPYTYETIKETSASTLGTMAKLRIGLTNAPTRDIWHHWDDLIIDDRNWVDRRPHPVSRMGRVLSA